MAACREENQGWGGVGWGGVRPRRAVTCPANAPRNASLTSVISPRSRRVDGAFAREKGTRAVE